MRRKTKWRNKKYMNIIWCLLLLITYAGFVLYVIKGGNMFFGTLVMGTLWCIIGVLSGVMSPADVLTNVMSGPLTQGNTIITMFFGSWFGMILMESGIAPSIVRRTVELSGDKAVLTNILLCLVTCIIFCSCFGPGAVIGIGVIVFPILLSIGIPKPVALCSFIISIGAGMFINPTFHAQIVGSNLASRGIENQFSMERLRFNGYIGLAVQMAVVIVMILVMASRTKRTRPWSVQSKVSSGDKKMTPLISFLTPLVPIVMIAVFHWDAIPAFTLACVYALVTCGRIRNMKDAEQMMTRSFCSGVESLGPMMGFLVCQTIFIQSATGVSPLISSVLGNVFPSTYLGIFIIFLLIIPLGLFRGPSTLCGTGTVLLTIFLTLGFSPQYVMTTMLFTSIGTTISCCPTQSWSIWAMNYTKVESRDFLKPGIPWAFAATVLNLIIVYITVGIHC